MGSVEIYAIASIILIMSSFFLMWLFKPKEKIIDDNRIVDEIVNNVLNKESKTIKKRIYKTKKQL
jgi:hypothetical protein